MQIPLLETVRLIVRPFTLDDFEAAYQLFDIDLGDPMESSRENRREWLQWTVLNYAQLAKLHQTPYGERAVVLKESSRLVGAVGLVPLLNLHARIPSLCRPDDSLDLNTPEVGLFWAIAPAYQKQGFATEAAGALIRYAFDHLRLARILACTEYENTSSQRVMEKLGMRIERNAYPDPPWLQVVGILENAGSAKA